MKYGPCIKYFHWSCKEFLFFFSFDWLVLWICIGLDMWKVDIDKLSTTSCRPTHENVRKLANFPSFLQTVTLCIKSHLYLHYNYAQLIIIILISVITINSRKLIIMIIVITHMLDVIAQEISKVPSQSTYRVLVTKCLGSLKPNIHCLKMRNVIKRAHSVKILVQKLHDLGVLWWSSPFKNLIWVERLSWI